MATTLQKSEARDMRRKFKDALKESQDVAKALYKCAPEAYILDEYLTRSENGRAWDCLAVGIDAAIRFKVTQNSWDGKFSIGRCSVLPTGMANDVPPGCEAWRWILDEHGDATAQPNAGRNEKKQ